MKAQLLIEFFFDGGRIDKRTKTDIQIAPNG
jgi:hypothetical protein